MKEEHTRKSKIEKREILEKEEDTCSDHEKRLVIGIEKGKNQLRDDRNAWLRGRKIKIGVGKMFGPHGQEIISMWFPPDRFLEKSVILVSVVISLPLFVAAH